MAALYTGTDPSHFQSTKKVIHCPLIEIVPKDLSDLRITAVFDDIERYTHVIFTSKNVVPLFCACMKNSGLAFHGKVIAVGKVTAICLEKAGILVDQIATDERQEGIIELLQMEDLDNAYVLIPRSSKSRPLLEQFLQTHGVRHQLCDMYDTVVRTPEKLPDLEAIEEIIFTSPSTVDAFIRIFGTLPSSKQLTPIGPVTEHKLWSVQHGKKI